VGCSRPYSPGGTLLHMHHDMKGKMMEVWLFFNLYSRLMDVIVLVVVLVCVMLLHLHHDMKVKISTGLTFLFSLYFDVIEGD